MTKSLAIVGASGHGKVLADIAETIGYKVIFFDDAYPKKNKLEHWPIAGTSKTLCDLVVEYPDICIAIGDNSTRYEKHRMFSAIGFNFITLIDPSARISQYATIGIGSVIMPNAVVNAFSTIGEGCIINTGSTVEHDCFVGEFSHISPNASLAGGVEVGKLSWVGIGANVKQLISIGQNTVVGAGSVVVKNLPSNVICFGTPAEIKNR